MDKVIDSYNAIVGAIVLFLSTIFGKHWIIFTVFLILNTIDWFSGWIKSRIKHTENSLSGLKGILKKLGYWLMIAIAFATGIIFVEIGNIIGINLYATTFLGWFVLASLTVNELRSICENFIECGLKVPKIFIKGLKIVEEKLDNDHFQK